VEVPHSVCCMKWFIPSLFYHLIESWDCKPVKLKSETFEFVLFRFALEDQRAMIGDGGCPGVEMGSGEIFFP
jgi:hypothetical protein